MKQPFAFACAVILLLGCDHSGTTDAGTDAGAMVPNRKPFTLAEARDPQKCKQCHPNHYREWASSMHAYAAVDPVFIAMNKRGQRETNGALGDFCVKCHAPMAVLEGKTTDGLNLDELSDDVKGVTCYFCHNATGIEGEHNGRMLLSNDVTMRGPFRNPKQPGVHRAEYSELFNDGSPKSASMCGGCHDIHTPVPADVHLERTFEEYRKSLFSKTEPNRQNFLTCAGCHMIPRENQLAANDPPSHVGTRTVHEHLWPGVDVALTDFPDRQAQKLAVECALQGGGLITSLDQNAGPGQFGVALETEAGHAQPSGAAQDRRMWLEITGYDAAGKVISQSGNIADGELEDSPANANVWMFRDHIFDKDGNPTHMFWEVARSDMYMDGYTSHTLQPATLPGMLHSATRTFQLPPVARVRVHLRMRPMGMDVLQDLVASGDLDPNIPSQVPTFTMYGTDAEWKEGGPNVVTAPNSSPLDCPNSYLCLLQPGSVYCDGEDAGGVATGTAAN